MHIKALSTVQNSRVEVAPLWEHNAKLVPTRVVRRNRTHKSLINDPIRVVANRRTVKKARGGINMARRDIAVLSLLLESTRGRKNPMNYGAT